MILKKGISECMHRRRSSKRLYGSRDGILLLVGGEDWASELRVQVRALLSSIPIV